MTQISNTAEAIDTLLSANGVSVADLEQAFGELSGYDVDYCDLYFQKTVNESFVLEEGIVKNCSYSNDVGVGVRAIQKDKSALAYSDEISKKSIIEAIQTVRSIGNSTEKAKTVKIQTKQEPHKLYISTNPIDLAETNQKIALIEKLDKFTRDLSPYVKQVIVALNSVHDTVLVVRDDGKIVGDLRPLVRMDLHIIAEKNGRKESATSGGGGRFTLDYFTDEILQNFAHEAVSAALTNLEAKEAPAGILPVVLGCGWPGILLHEAVGHGLEGDFIRKGTSIFTEMVGKKIAADSVTVVDDGTIANRRGSLSIDDEGNETKCTTLIDEGVLRGFMQDELNSRLTGQMLTGNGRRESFAHLPMPRMTNTYMLKGDKSPQEIIESVDYGIFAKSFGGGQVDITSGNFVFSMNEAWLIEKGQITYPIKGATLIGNGADALLKIKMVGSDIQLDSGVGVCGKDGQSVPVGVGMPTLRIDGLTVGGTKAV